MAKRVYLMLGGFAGPDGWVFSQPFMLTLRPLLLELPDVNVHPYTWDEYKQAGADIDQHQNDKIAVLAYSGGCWTSCLMANLPSKSRIDLLVLYDPSPPWKMDDPASRLWGNVKKVISYENPKSTMPSMFGMLGGGKVHSSTPEVIDRFRVTDNHVIIQGDVALHRRTVAYVRAL